MPRPRKPRNVRLGRVRLDDDAVRVAVVGGPDPVRQARRAREIGADVVEARVDLWGERDPDRLRETLRRVRRASGRPVILTIRSKGSGGAWEAKGRGERRRLETYRFLLKEADAVDIEFTSKGRSRIARAARRARRPVAFSHHETRRPLGARALEALATRMRRAGADVVKIAPYCRRREELVEALSFLGRTAHRPVAMTPMGPWGSIGRVVAPVFGSALEYVPAAGRPVAEGQVPAGVLDRSRETIGLSRLLRRARA